MQVALVLLLAGLVVQTVEAETGTHMVFALAGGGDIAFGAEYGAQLLAVCGSRQLGHLTADGLERQLCGLAETVAVVGAADNRCCGAGQALLLPIQRVP